MRAVPMPPWSTLAVRRAPVLPIAAGLAPPVSARATPFSTGDPLDADARRELERAPAPAPRGGARDRRRPREAVGAPGEAARKRLMER